MSRPAVALERLRDNLEGFQKLTPRHFEEVDGGVDSRRPFDPDWEMMLKLEDLGMFLFFSAKQGDELIGYLTWTIVPDLESRGLMVGNQGAWFVLPGFPRVAHRLFGLSVITLQDRGVAYLLPHHRTQGRGEAIGGYFKFWGAKLIQQTHFLWIGR